MYMFIRVSAVISGLLYKFSTCVEGCLLHCSITSDLHWTWKLCRRWSGMWFTVQHGLSQDQHLLSKQRTRYCAPRCSCVSWSRPVPRASSGDCWCSWVPHFWISLGRSSYGGWEAIKPGVPLQKWFSEWLYLFLQYDMLNLVMDYKSMDKLMFYSPFYLFCPSCLPSYSSGYRWWGEY